MSVCEPQPTTRIHVSEGREDGGIKVARVRKYSWQFYLNVSHCSDLPGQQEQERHVPHKRNDG